ncbi:MAG: RnfABCDGE type electron transport complex subunit D [Clostridia bacterium]|nr:RnfABCDGE type electron transport complex subunit D [Clostridia bacterium]
MKMISPPFSHTKDTPLSHVADRLIALAPVLIWSVWIFGARVITVCLISVLFCFIFDAAVRRFIFREAYKNNIFDPNNAVYGLLAAFMMPVAVPLWMPVLSALLVTAAKNLRYPGGRRIFNPYIFSAAVLNLLFRETMTAFTRPLAYFNAFTPVLDERLVSGYRVLSPLQYIADGRVYENGLLPQFIGYASGCVGEIAIAALLLGAIWLFIKKEADWRAPLAFVFAMAIPAYLLPSSDSETIYYVLSLLLSGGAVFAAIYGLTEGTTTPLTKGGKVIAGAVCGLLAFAGRKFFGGYETVYFAVLAVNLVSPLLEKLIRPAPAGRPEKKR